MADIGVGDIHDRLAALEQAIRDLMAKVIPIPSPDPPPPPPPAMPAIPFDP